MRVTRLLNAPIITPGLHPSIGKNIQGPSLIRVPDWVQASLGTYYLYFADHKGSYIRLAYADDLRGPWKVYPPGSLQIADSRFLTEPPDAPAEAVEEIKTRLKSLSGPDQLPHDLLTELTTPHIASPDVHIDSPNQTIVMYFHGLEGLGHQVTRVATSQDGIRFTTRPEILGRSYLRAFPHADYTCAMAMPGQFYRSKDGLPPFEEGPLLVNKNMRHAAFLKREGKLYVFWTQVGDTPERILLSTIELSPDWQTWQETEAVEVLRPERQWEGADAPLESSVRSVAYGHVNQLRDPANLFGRRPRLFALCSGWRKWDCDRRGGHRVGRIEEWAIASSEVILAASLKSVELGFGCS